MDRHLVGWTRRRGEHDLGGPGGRSDHGFGRRDAEGGSQDDNQDDGDQADNPEPMRGRLRRPDLEGQRVLRGRRRGWAFPEEHLTQISNRGRIWSGRGHAGRKPDSSQRAELGSWGIIPMVSVGRRRFLGAKSVGRRGSEGVHGLTEVSSACQSVELELQIIDRMESTGDRLQLRRRSTGHQADHTLTAQPFLHTLSRLG